MKTISCENVLSKPQLVSYFNLLKVTQQDIDLVKYDFSFNSFGIADFQVCAILKWKGTILSKIFAVIVLI